MDLRPPNAPPAGGVRVSEVLAALSFALDLTEGQPMGHALRACLIGMRIGERLGLPLERRRDLYYALLLKDAGCSSNSARVFQVFGGDDHAAKRDLKRVNWSDYFTAARYAAAHAAPGASWFERARRIAGLARGGQRLAASLVEARCERGADIVTRLGFGPGVAEAVRSLDEHWDGRGHPTGRAGAEIPQLARILGLAQTLEVFLALEGPARALEIARERSGTWFDPGLVAATQGMDRDLATWRALDEHDLSLWVAACEPGEAPLLAAADALDRVAGGFADVVDAKSPFTAAHSRRMTDLAVRIAGRLGVAREALPDLRRAALLHDLGKLSVPNRILDKPARLDADEWEVVKRHPYFTMRILLHVRGFKHIAEVAAAHHERLDGRGYFRGLAGPQLPLEAQILATADMFDALTAARPYRPPLPVPIALGILERDRGKSVSGECLDSLVEVLDQPDGDARAAA